MLYDDDDDDDDDDDYDYDDPIKGQYANLALLASEHNYVRRLNTCLSVKTNE